MSRLTTGPQGCACEAFNLHMELKMRRDALPTIAQRARLKSTAGDSFIAMLWAIMALAGGLVVSASQSMAAGVETFTQKPFSEGSTKTIDHTAWDQLLKTYVVAEPDGLNRVDYARFKT